MEVTLSGVFTTGFLNLHSTVRCTVFSKVARNLKVAICRRQKRLKLSPQLLRGFIRHQRDPRSLLDALGAVLIHVYAGKPFGARYRQNLLGQKAVPYRIDGAVLSTERGAVCKHTCGRTCNARQMGL